MPTATYLGLATSPADLYYRQYVSSQPPDLSAPALDARPPSDLLLAIRSIFPGSDSSTSATPKLQRRTYELTDRQATSANPHTLGGSSTDEELAWFGRRVVWSKGGMIYRTFSYDREKEDVKSALFAWFADASEDEARSQPTGQGRPALGGRQHAQVELDSSTFGPFSTSQHATWSDPRRQRRDRKRSSDSSSSDAQPKRCLVVFLQTQAHIYRATGHVQVVTFPFPVGAAWAMPPGYGGLLLQRQSGGVGWAQPSSADGRAQMEEMPIFHLRHPDKEVTPVGLVLSPSAASMPEIQTTVTSGVRITSFPPGLMVQWVSEEEHPLIIALDRTEGSLVFYRWTHLDNPALLNAGPAQVGDVHAPNLASAAAVTLPLERSTLARSRSSYAPITDRRRSTGGPSTVAGRSPAAKARRVSGAQDVMAGSTSSDAITQANALRQVLEPAAGLPHAGAPALHVRMDVDPPGMTGRNARRSSRGHQADPASIRPPGSSAGLSQAHRVPRMDARDTTMLMGLEETEDDLKTDLVLQEIHKWSDPTLLSINPDKLKVFASSNDGTGTDLNVHVLSADPTLYIFRYQQKPSHIPPVVELRSYPVLSAAPIRCTDEFALDVAFTTTNSTDLHILPSCGSVFALALPDHIADGRDEVACSISSALSMSLPVKQASTGETSGRSIFGASVVGGIGSRLSLLLPSGHTIRICVDMTSRNRLIAQSLRYSRLIAGSEGCDFLRQIAFAKPYSLANFEAFSTAITVQLEAASSGRLPTTSAWDKLSYALRGSRQGKMPLSRKPMVMTPGIYPDLPPTTDWNSGTVGRLLVALHAVGEDCRLDSSRDSETFAVARLVAGMAASLGQAAYADHWLRIFPQIAKDLRQPTVITSEPMLLPEPLDTFRLLDNSMRQSSTPLERHLPSGLFPDMNTVIRQVCPNLLKMLDTYSIIFEGNPPLGLGHELAAKVIERLVALDMDELYLRRLPWGFASPLFEAIRVCQDLPAKHMTVEALSLIRRVDLACMSAQGKNELDLDTGGLPVSSLNFFSRTVSSSWCAIFSLQIVNRADRGSVDIRSLLNQCGQESAGAVLPHHGLPNLRFTQDRRLQDVADMLQTTVKRIIRPEEKPNLNDYDLDIYYQTLANSIGMRTLASIPGKAMLTYGIAAPDITERWLVPPINLDIYFTIPKRTFTAKLATSHGTSSGWTGFHNGVAAALNIRRDCAGIDSSWIIYNKPETPTPEHGGFLFGLGLTGHLRSLVSWHAYPYLEPRHEHTTIGLLLGLAASYTGSQDKLLTKILSLNVQALLPEGSFDLNSPPSVQAASMLCVGLVYAGSGNYRIAEVALDQMSAKLEPGIEHHADQREAYAFSAAMSFGLTMLGQGVHASGEFEAQMLSRIRQYINGMPAALESRNKDMSAEVDINMTAPGATLALGLMYLRSHRADISTTIKLPQTPYELEHIRPDLLFTRSLGLALVNWNDIRPTTEWVRSCVPRFILAIWDTRKGGGHVDELIELAFYHIVAGCCFAIGLRFASSLNESAHAVLLHFHGLFYMSSSQQSQTYEAKLRRSAVRQGFSISAIALAMVVAGSGDLSVYRRFRMAHWQESNFGIRTAMHMAAGLVFLGAGKCSLGNSDTAIAAMVIAFLPKFSSQPDDNRAYLQAYRHLWALAVEPRCFVTTDAHTLDKVYLPIKIKVKENSSTADTRSVQGISPTLLDSLDRVASVTTQSPRYTTGSLDMTDRRDRRRFTSNQTLFVQRKAAFLDYSVDPKGYRTFQSFVAPFSVYGQDDAKDVPGRGSMLGVTTDELQDLVQAHATTLLTRAWASKLIPARGMFPDIARLSLATAFERMLVECIMNDREWILPTHLTLVSSQRTRGPEAGTGGILQYVLASSYVALTRPDLDKLYAVHHAQIQHVHLKAQRSTASEAALMQYYTAARRGSSAIETFRQDPNLATYLVVQRVPALPVLNLVHQRLVRADERVTSEAATLPQSHAAMVRLILCDMGSPLPQQAQPLATTMQATERERAKSKASARAVVLQRMGHATAEWTGIMDALKAWSQPAS